MSQLVWDEAGKRYWETGTSHGVLFVQAANGNTYNQGVAWNGLTAVTESPGGAEANDIYADDMKYASIRSAETWGGTIEAYMYPDEFLPCDGCAEPVNGLVLGQQGRSPFGFAYKTKIGNDTVSDADDGYKIHLVYNATASPSEKSYQTINESPEAMTFSWEISTTPVAVPGFKPMSTITIDSRTVDAAKLKTFEGILYGTDETEPRLMSPSEVLAHFGYTPPNE